MGMQYMCRPIVIASRIVGNKQYGPNILHMTFPYEIFFFIFADYRLCNREPVHQDR
jgi:hypothetical protein